jgi:hypothetical protein
VPKRKRKLPRAVIPSLMETCELMSKFTGKSAAEYFKYFLSLIDKYDYYFFDSPWPEKFDHEVASTFTDDDLDFLFEVKEEYNERYDSLCLKKNIFLDGFPSYFALMWTSKAYHKEFIRPQLMPISDAFLKLAKNGENAPEVLGKLKDEFESVSLIHFGLLDRREVEYFDKPADLLLDKILELIHTQEGYPECTNGQCRYRRKSLHKTQ